MQSTVIFVIMIFVAVFLSILTSTVLVFLPLILSGAEDKAHARRLADARMNARLLRFNL